MASHSASTRAYRRPPEKDSGMLAKVVALFLGILVPILGFFALAMWMDAREARDSARSRQPITATTTSRCRCRASPGRCPRTPRSSRRHTRPTTRRCLRSPTRTW